MPCRSRPRNLLQEEWKGAIHAEIARVKKAFALPRRATWHVDTDRGETQFVLKGEEDIHRISLPRS
jgi:hypothetical protein